MVKKPVFTEGEIIRHIEEDEFDEVLDLLESAFPHVSREFFRSITIDDPNYDPRFSLAIDRDGVLLSFLQIFDRTLWVEGDKVRIGGIGSVGTAPQHRRRGYGTALILESIEVMQKARMDASILFTTIQPFYARHGWKSIKQKYQEIPLPKLVFSGIDEKKIPEMRDEWIIWNAGEDIPPRQLRSIKSIYNKTLPTQTGKIIRDPEYWSQSVKWCRDAGAIIKESGSTRSYFRYRLIEDSVMLITEYGLATARDAERLIDAMILLARENQVCSLLGCFFANRGLRKYLENSPLPLQEQPNRYLMWNDLGSKKPFLPILNAAAEKHNFCYWITDAF